MKIEGMNKSDWLMLVLIVVVLFLTNFNDLQTIELGQPCVVAVKFEQMFADGLVHGHFYTFRVVQQPVYV